VSLRDFGRRLIPTGEQSGLLTRIAATESGSLRARMKSCGLQFDGSLALHKGRKWLVAK
jgi:hypothetical protein